MTKRTRECVLERLRVFHPSQAHEPRMALLARIECMRSIMEWEDTTEAELKKLNRVCGALHGARWRSDYRDDTLACQRADALVKLFKA